MWTKKWWTEMDASGQEGKSAESRVLSGESKRRGRDENVGACCTRLLWCPRITRIGTNEEILDSGFENLRFFQSKIQNSTFRIYFNPAAFRSISWSISWPSKMSVSILR